jgi:hypothetical protein
VKHRVSRAVRFHVRVNEYEVRPMRAGSQYVLDDAEIPRSLQGSFVYDAKVFVVVTQPKALAQPHCGLGGHLAVGVGKHEHSGFFCVDFPSFVHHYAALWELSMRSMKTR